MFGYLAEVSPVRVCVQGDEIEMDEALEASAKARAIIQIEWNGENDSIFGFRSWE
jgi:hypothetical protein